MTSSSPRPTDSSASAPRPHRARRGEGDRLREELLDAAEALLVERGHPDAVSMRALASRVGVTPAAIYLHFADKEELFFETCERRFVELAGSAVEALQEADDAPSRILALGRAYVRWGLANREHYAVTMGGAISPPAGTDPTTLTGRGAFTILLEVVRRGVEAGELRADIAPEEAATYLWACVHGYVSLVTTKQPFVPDVDLAAAEDAVLEAAVAALTPR